MYKDIRELFLSDLQPSQFYISQKKLREVERWFTPDDLSSFEAIPVKMLDGIPVMTDGHTRAVAALRAGLEKVPLVREADELSWEMYRRCVRACREEGVLSPADLLGRIIPREEYRVKWDGWCDKMQAEVDREYWKGRKMLVIGSPGSGKSTFSRKLRDATGLSLHYLDMIWHNPDRTTVSREVFDERLAGLLSGSEWIIDGNYMRTLHTRLERCTDVFFFDLPLEQCLEGAASRVGTVREDLPWVEDELDREFRQYIIDFQTDQLPRIYELLDRYRDSRAITVFRSREEADAFLEQL